MPQLRCTKHPGSLAVRLVFSLVIPLAVYALWAVRLDAHLRPFGDEGVYLLLAHSLAYDGDVDLRNNLQRPAPGLSEAAAGLPVADYHGDGRLHALENLGLPFLLALPYRIGGVLGARMAIVICAAVLWATLVRLAEHVTGDATAATIGVALVGLTVPVLAYVGTIWTEIPAAAVTALACWVTLREKVPRPVTCLITSGLLASLPWLHVRYILLAAVMLVWLGIRNWRSYSPSAVRLFCIFLPQGVSYALLSLVFWRLYGSPWPNAPYRAWFGWPWFVWSLPHIFRGAVGLFVDQEFGLFFYAPYLVAAMAGLVFLGRERPLGFAIAGALAGLVLPASTFAMWWGGDSPPARLILPGVALLAVPLAQALASNRSLRFRLPFAFLLSWSLFLTGLYICHPEWLRSEDGDRIARPLKELGWGALASFFPSTATKTIDYDAVGLGCGSGEQRAFEGQSLWYVSENAPAGTCLQRLSLELPRGRFRIAVRMRLVPPTGKADGVFLHLRLFGSDGSPVTERQITTRELAPPAEWQEYEMPFSLAANTALTFEVQRVAPAEVWLERTRVEPAALWPDLGQAALWGAFFAGLGVSWATPLAAVPGRGRSRQPKRARKRPIRPNLSLWMPQGRSRCSGRGGIDAA